MKYVSVITDYAYLLWQQELQAFNFKQLGILDDLICVVLYDPGQQLSDAAKNLAAHVKTYYYVNNQPKRHYIPSNKPFGLMKLLQEHPEYGEKLFLLDSDVIFREVLDFSKLDADDHWYVSDTIGYIGHYYLNDMLGPEGVEEMAGLVGLTGDYLKTQQANSGGAQYYMKNVTAAFCESVTADSIKIYDWACQQKRPNGTYKIQVWTAEMWSWLWNAFKVAPVRVSDEMAFAWAPHDVSDWHAKKLMHLAGVTETMSGAFFKGKYHTVAPWDVEDNFDFVDRSKCWAPYIDLIETYKSDKYKHKRALVCYLDNTPSLVNQAKALLECIKYNNFTDTDLVLFGPEIALNKINNHKNLIKVIQEKHKLASSYGFINSIYCLNGPGCEVLNKYDFILKTDLDTFVTPAFKNFKPKSLVVGQGFYSNSVDIKNKCISLADKFNLNHRGKHNLGSTMYGPTSLVRDVCKLATEICEYLLETEFRDHHGSWPDWFRGVSTMYASEIALNHLVPDLEGPSELLDFFSTSTESTQNYPHVHCWHTNELFSKFEWETGSYQHYNLNDLNPGIIREYCLMMALRSQQQ